MKTVLVLDLLPDLKELLCFSHPLVPTHRRSVILIFESKPSVHTCTYTCLYMYVQAGVSSYTHTELEIF